MKVYAPEAIRNVGLLSHMGNGKTSLAEAMLYASGAISRLGRVDDGTTTSDYDPDEQRRGMSANLTLLPLEWQDAKVNLVDTPGYADFVGEVSATLRVVDGAVLLVSAVDGLEVGTEQAWALALQRAPPGWWWSTAWTGRTPASSASWSSCGSGSAPAWSPRSAHRLAGRLPGRGRPRHAPGRPVRRGRPGHHRRGAGRAGVRWSASASS